MFWGRQGHRSQSDNVLYFFFVKTIFEPVWAEREREREMVRRRGHFLNSKIV